MDGLFGDWKRPTSSVEYRVFFRDLLQDKADELAKFILLRRAARSWTELKDVLHTYLWFNESFSLSPSLETDKGGGALYSLSGKTDCGEATEDEWFIVYCLMSLSREFGKEAAIEVIDEDGQFLLIEAADVLPSWLTPEVAESSVYIYKGDIVVWDGAKGMEKLTKSERRRNALNDIFAGKGRRYVRLNEVIKEKLAEYPATAVEKTCFRRHLTLPVATAAVLRKFPSLVSLAVKSYCERHSLHKSSRRTKMVTTTSLLSNKVKSLSSSPWLELIDNIQRQHTTAQTVSSQASPSLRYRQTQCLRYRTPFVKTRVRFTQRLWAMLRSQKLDVPLELFPSEWLKEGGDSASVGAMVAAGLEYAFAEGHRLLEESTSRSKGSKASMVNPASYFQFLPDSEQLDCLFPAAPHSNPQSPADFTIESTEFPEIGNEQLDFFSFVESLYTGDRKAEEFFNGDIEQAFLYARYTDDNLEEHLGITESGLRRLYDCSFFSSDGLMKVASNNAGRKFPTLPRLHRLWNESISLASPSCNLGACVCLSGYRQVPLAFEQAFDSLLNSFEDRLLEHDNDFEIKGSDGLFKSAIHNAQKDNSAEDIIARVVLLTYTAYEGLEKETLTHSEDDEGFINVTEEDVDRILQERGQRRYSGPDGANDDEVAEALQGVVSSVKGFVSKVSGVEGAEVRQPHKGDVGVDFSRLREVLEDAFGGKGEEGPREGGDEESTDDDEEEDLLNEDIDFDDGILNEYVGMNDDTLSSSDSEGEDATSSSEESKRKHTRHAPLEPSLSDYSAAMDAELEQTAIGKSYAEGEENGEVPRGKNKRRTRATTEAASGSEQSGLRPISIDANLISSLMQSVGAGDTEVTAASQLLSALSKSLPKQSKEETR